MMEHTPCLVGDNQHSTSAVPCLLQEEIFDLCWDTCSSKGMTLCISFAITFVTRATSIFNYKLIIDTIKLITRHEVPVAD